jgi:hypothetical protein
MILSFLTFFSRTGMGRSSKLYPIGLSLKKIQDILRMDQPMDNDRFNFGLHIVACEEILHMK